LCTGAAEGDDADDDPNPRAAAGRLAPLMPPTTAVDDRRPAGDQILLMVGMLAGPIAWSAHLLLIYALIPVACALGSAAPIHLTTLVTALLTVGGGVLAARSWWRAGDDRTARFMGLGGMLLGGLFLFAILMEGMPPLILGPCA
jgi:hypothetical protein